MRTFVGIFSRAYTATRGIPACSPSSSKIIAAVPIFISARYIQKSPSRLPRRGLEKDETKRTISEVVVPVEVKAVSGLDSSDALEDLVGRLDRSGMIAVLNEFIRHTDVLRTCHEYGLDSTLFQKAAISFRRFCLDSNPLPPELHVTMSDILRTAGSSRGSIENTSHLADLLPHFLDHARLVFPHLACIKDLKAISDLRMPQNWYPDARAIQRRIIYHAGPTNSGKTFKALERMSSAVSGVYCGPLKLLASEVYFRLLGNDLPCDLVTGDERRCYNEDGTPVKHTSCTVEMVPKNIHYEVAVIDEIQMLRDVSRGWAWTAALLGVCAEEVHVCGEDSAIDVVKKLLEPVAEEVNVCRYERLTPLKLSDAPLGSLRKVRPGDAIVCFNKTDLYHKSRFLERLGIITAVIYGSLPPSTKLTQAKRFNDENDPCKVLVATDAIGMGLNLSIKRVIFSSLSKPEILENGERVMSMLTPSQVRQIGGRAGRYGTIFSDGEVTVMNNSDFEDLHMLFKKPTEPIERVGLYPTFDMIEMYAYHLPNATLSNLLDIFVCTCSLDESKFFICDLDSIKFMADMLNSIPLPLNIRYTFCLAPVDQRQPFVCAMVMMYARRVSRFEPVTLDWLSRHIGWPFYPPKTVAQLSHLEDVFDVLDVYLWLGYRMEDMFPDMELVRNVQAELDVVIEDGVRNITALIKKQESARSSGMTDDDPDSEQFFMKRKAVKAADEAATDGDLHMIATGKRTKEEEVVFKDFMDKAQKMTSAKAASRSDKGGQKHAASITKSQKRFAAKRRRK